MQANTKYCFAVTIVSTDHVPSPRIGTKTMYCQLLYVNGSYNITSLLTLSPSLIINCQSAVPWKLGHHLLIPPPASFCESG